MLAARMQRAAMLDSRVYEEVERDEQGNTQAAQVVIIAAIATGLGTLLFSLLRGRGDVGILGGLAAALLGWVIWSWVTYFIGTRLFGGTATPGELLRALGFAQAPQILNILAFLPFIGGLVHVIVPIWLIATGIVAVRQALDFDTGRAILTMLVGWVLMILIHAVYFGILHTMGLA
jgi:hypothetical protein